jgi:hypothetical protein
MRVSVPSRRYMEGQPGNLVIRFFGVHGVKQVRLAVCVCRRGTHAAARRPVQTARHDRNLLLPDPHCVIRHGRVPPPFQPAP